MYLKSTLAALAFAAFALPAFADGPVKITFSDVTTADAARSRALTERFFPALGDDFEVKSFFSGTLMPQGSELTAIQRGNLQMALLPPSDFATQAPEFDILGAAYVVRDADHMKKIFESPVGDYFRDLARKKLSVEILAPAYYGTRQVNLRGDRHVETPKDLNGVTLRMPGGESWQFLGESIGASPVPMAYSEVYTALQTGVIDGQDNPLPNDYSMKFYEVTNQIVMTSHNVGFGLLIIDAGLFDSLTPEQQQRMRTAAKDAFAWSDNEYLQEEEKLVEFFRKQGLKIYTPDVAAFQHYAQQKYLESEISAAWPVGMLDQINAL